MTDHFEDLEAFYESICHQFDSVFISFYLAASRFTTLLLFSQYSDGSKPMIHSGVLIHSHIWQGNQTCCYMCRKMG